MIVSPPKGIASLWSATLRVREPGMVPPVSIAIDRAGRYAMGAPVGGGNDGGATCGQPNLMRSTDGVTWTTCAPGTRGIAEGTDPGYPLVTFAGNDKVYEVFRTRQAGGGLQPGLVVWREP